MQLAQHGLAFLALAMFLQAIGLPIPGAVALILAAAQAATGHVSGFAVLGSALLAMLAGDAVMFLLGRRTGWWLLGLLCRVSLIPKPAFCDRQIPSIVAAARSSSSPNSFPGSTPWRRRSRAA